MDVGQDKKCRRERLLILKKSIEPIRLFGAGNCKKREEKFGIEDVIRFFFRGVALSEKCPRVWSQQVAAIVRTEAGTLAGV